MKYPSHRISCYRVFIVIFALMGCLSVIAESTYAAQRNLPGIDIITRAERGADESRRYTTKASVDKSTLDRQNYDDYVEGLKATDIDKYLDIQRKRYEDQTADDYLDQMYSIKFAVSRVVSFAEDSYLKRPYTYAQRKSQIIIHHTANDYTLITGGTQGLYGFIRGIYRFHTFTRNRGDIGYHFLIGPGGEIFEGRAGGPDVTAAHAAWNNIPSIGISLIGNFEIQEPTAAQIDAVKRLSLAIAQKYGIDPQVQTQYHKRISAYPYIQDYPNLSLVGHRDAGTTSCPGRNLYTRLDEIRSYVSQNLTAGAGFTDGSSNNITANIRIIRPLSAFVMSNNEGVLTQQVFLSGFSNTCNLASRSIKIVSCAYESGTIRIRLRKDPTQIASGPLRINLPLAGGKQVQIQASVLRWTDIPLILEARKKSYLATNPQTAPAASQKVVSKQTLQQASSNLIYGMVSVLLYELSTSYNQRSVRCTATCDVSIDGQLYPKIRSAQLQSNSDGTINIVMTGDKATTSTQLNGVKEAKFVSDIEGMVRIENYTRTSLKGIPRNVFRDTITFKSEPIRLLGANQATNQIVLINTLWIKDYMKGIVESHDGEHLEKNKVMALISKTYMLYYLDKKNPHPSIPASASYNAIDDARIFQKYAGAGVEQTITKRYQALDQTRDQLLVYQGTIPILPYFSCSAGFTRSGKEKRGRTDTPYLKTVIDIGTCDTKEFNGHGVGLSGKGAQTMAQRNIKAIQILQWYYPGIQLVSAVE